MNVTSNSGILSALETSVGGMKKAVKGMNKAAQNIADGNVDATQMVALNEAEILAKANALAVRTENRAAGALLDVVA